MTWSIVHGRDGAVAARRLGECLGLPAGPRAASGSDHVVFVGDDASLAEFAAGTGPATPILYAPEGRSDLARMFRWGDRTVESRLESGGPYAADLVAARSSAGEHHLVGHGVGSRRGRIPGWSARRRQVSVSLKGAVTHHRASAVIVANAQHVDGRTVAPRAAVMDSRAEIQMLGGSRRDRIRVLRAMQRGLHLRRAGLYRRSFSDAVIELPPGWVMALDGLVVPGRRWEFTVLPAAFTLWV